MARREFNPDLAYEALAFTLERFPDLMPKEGPVLLLNPRSHSSLSAFGPTRLSCITPEYTDCGRLKARGFTITESAPQPCAACIIFPGESRDETLFLFALGANALKENGVLIVSMSNDLGASRFEGRLEELIGKVDCQSKNHCRVFWGHRHTLDPQVLDAWLNLGEPKKITGTSLLSVPGLFSWNKIDQGSRTLAEVLPESVNGKIADLGCGYGYLSHSVLQKCPGATELQLFDSDRRAIALSQINIKPSSTKIPVTFHWLDIQAGVPEGYFDNVVMNPPFHEYGRLNIELGKRFFRAAHSCLKPGGTLYAVVNRHLPYDETLWGIFPTVKDLACKDGYRVLQAGR